MPKKNDPSTIRIRLAIDIPSPGPAEFKMGRTFRGKVPEYYANTIEHPSEGGNSYLKFVNGRWYMCVKGTADGAVQHVFAKVYNGTPSIPPEPPIDADTLWTRPDLNDQGHWGFDMLPVEGNVGPGPTQKTLAVWYDVNEEDYLTDEVAFNALDGGGYTYCELYGVSGMPLLFKKKDWTKMADRWHFTLKGCTNLKCGNCKCLDGEWIITRDKKQDKLFRWFCPMKESFADPKKSSFWRLVFNEKDGFWYLECLENLDQMPGIWISYRLHERAWDPYGPNKLILYTNSDYCNVPDTIILIPA